MQFSTFDCRLSIWKKGRDARQQAGLVAGPLPDDVFVVTSIDQAIDSAVIVSTEEDPAFHVFTKEDVAAFRQQFFFFAFAFDEELPGFGRDFPGLAGRKLVSAGES